MLVFISTLRPNCYDSPLIMSPAQLAEESYYFSPHLGSVEDDELAGVGGPGPGQLGPLVPRCERLPHQGPVPGPGRELSVTQQRAINTVHTWVKFV